jgi:hypothetical protein
MATNVNISPICAILDVARATMIGDREAEIITAGLVAAVTALKDNPDGLAKVAEAVLLSASDDIEKVEYQGVNDELVFIIKMSKITEES